MFSIWIGGRGSKRGVKKVHEIPTGPDLKAGWEVTMGERGERQKDTKGGRSSQAEKGNAQSRVGPQQRGALRRPGR